MPYNEILYVAKDKFASPKLFTSSEFSEREEDGN